MEWHCANSETSCKHMAAWFPHSKEKQVSWLKLLVEMGIIIKMIMIKKVVAGSQALCYLYAGRSCGEQQRCPPEPPHAY